MITTSEEAERWIEFAQRCTTAPRWENARKHLIRSGWEKHGGSENYDDGDIRFILKIPADEPQKFYDILAGLVEKGTKGDTKIFIGGAWKEDGKDGDYGIRVSQSVFLYLSQIAGATIESGSASCAR